MKTVALELEDDLLALLEQSNQSVQRAAREMMVLELFRRGTISSGKAGQLLGMERRQFIEHAARLGIPVRDLRRAGALDGTGLLEEPQLLAQRWLFATHQGCQRFRMDASGVHCRQGLQDCARHIDVLHCACSVYC